MSAPKTTRPPPYLPEESPTFDRIETLLARAGLLDAPAGSSNELAALWVTIAALANEIDNLNERLSRRPAATPTITAPAPGARKGV